MELLEVGKIVNTHGLRGEVKVVPWTDYPEVFEDIETLYLQDGRELNIKNVKYQKANIILKFSEINHIDEAEKLKNLIVSAERSALGELPEGVHYIADIIGLEVRDEAGERLGEISDVFSTGANDVYEVKREDKKPLLLPVIESVVKAIDIDGGTVTVHILDGLLDL